MVVAGTVPDQTVQNTDVLCPPRLHRNHESWPPSCPTTAAYRNALTAGHGVGPDHRQRLRQLLEEQRRWRNQPGGHWIAETDPAAADQAITRQFVVRSLDSIVIATDGVAARVERYGCPSPWREALALIRTHGPCHLLETVQGTEAHDPNGKLWPRSKRYDDKAIAVVTLQ